LQDAVGLVEDREKTISRALILQPEPIQTFGEISPTLIDPGDELLMYEHYRVGKYLWQRYRLHWAMAHLQKVIETGDFMLRTVACGDAAEVALYLADYSSAITFFDKQIEIFKSPDYTKQLGDSSQRVSHAQKQKVYCQAENAVAERDWESVQRLILEGWEIAGTLDCIADMNLVFVAYRLCAQKEDISVEFREKMKLRLKQVWQALEKDFLLSSQEDRTTKMVSMGNNAAWLLANTGGDYPSALTLIETARKAEPENIGFLDTLAHVYFLGGKWEDAIQTQELVVRLAPEATIFRQALERFTQAKASVPTENLPAITEFPLL
jgi:tetratricopeptide (TPR) repeat protein